MPPKGGRMRELAGALPGGAHKKRAQEWWIPEPFWGHYWGVDMFKIRKTGTYQLDEIHPKYSLAYSAKAVKNFSNDNSYVNAGLLRIF